MKIHLIAGKNLSAEDCLLWSQLQQADAALHSPYFRPEFVMNVAAVRADVEVAVLEEDGQTVGFFPFQRGSWNVARPVAAGLSDFQAVIERPRVSEVTSRSWTGDELIRGCGLAAWHFDHFLASQQTFGPFHRIEAASPYVDLSRGFDAYCAEQQQAGARVVSKIQQSVRRAERQLGPMRFAMHTVEPSVFAALLRWKMAKFVGTGFTNVLGFRWVLELLDRIRHTQSESFAGQLSALYFGDRLAAVHLGMRSSDVLHYWFPAYDTALGTYSPGMILLLQIMKAAPGLGIHRIDLGKGDEDYKVRLMSGATVVAEGSVECRSLARAWGCVRRGVARLAHEPVLGAPARMASQFSRPLRQWLMFR